MEIRLKYINQDSFYGSDYFIKRVGYEEKWDRVKRLGDTYYENELLERSVTEKYGSNLKIGKVENTASAIGTTENGKLSIDEYVGHNLENVDKLKTAGASVGVSTSGLTSIGVNYSDKKQEGITKNTVIGNVEIGKSSGDEINRDLDTMTEITEDRDFKTNINVESQTISYIKNPEKFKEDLQKAKNEIYDIYHAVDSTVNLQGEETRSPIEQVGEVRQAKVIYNLIDSRLQEAENQEDIAKIFEGASEDLGYKVKVIYTDPSNSPQLIGVDKNGNKYIKDGTAYVDEKTGINYILVNTKSPANSTKAGVIGTIAEEQSHIIGKKEGRQKVVPDGSEKGLESLGRPTNDYFKKQYSKNDKAIDLKSDGKDYSNVDFGENVGDKKNEGWDIYTKDIRKEKQPNGKYYTEKEMQDNINNVFGKGKFDIDWKEYEDNEKYRTQSNYYYFQAKYTLKSNKVNEITDDYIIIQNNDKNINDYFKKQYSKNDKAIDLKSDGKDYSNVDFGENVGDNPIILAAIIGSAIGGASFYKFYKNTEAIINKGIENVKNKENVEKYIKTREAKGVLAMSYEMAKEFKDAGFSIFSNELFAIYGATDEIRKIYLKKELDKENNKMVDTLVLDKFFPEETKRLWKSDKTFENLYKVTYFWYDKANKFGEYEIDYDNRERSTRARPDFTWSIKNSEFYALGTTLLFQSTYGSIKKTKYDKYVEYDVDIKVIFQYKDKFEDVKNVNPFQNAAQNKGMEFEGGVPFDFRTEPREVSVKGKFTNIKDIEIEIKKNMLKQLEEE